MHKNTNQVGLMLLLLFLFQFIDTMVNINITSVCQVSENIDVIEAFLLFFFFFFLTQQRMMFSF